MGHHGDLLTAVAALERVQGHHDPRPELSACLPAAGSHIEVAGPEAGEILGPAPRGLLTSEPAPLSDVELAEPWLHPGGDPEMAPGDLGGLACPSEIARHQHRERLASQALAQGLSLLSAFLGEGGIRLPLPEPDYIHGGLGVANAEQRIHERGRVGIRAHSLYPPRLVWVPYRPMVGPDPPWLSLLPALVSIFLAFPPRQVLVALFAGVLTGSVVLLLQGSSVADANPITRFLLPAIGSKGYAKILLIYLWCLGGLIGIWGKTGGARHFAKTVGGWMSRGPRSSLLFGWLVGILFHQGGTVSTVLAGTTVKPVADRHRISHEELSYVVDSTASPVATILPFNAWPAYVATLVVGTIPLLPDEAASYRFFLSSIPFNFYALFAVAATLLFSLDLLPWIGGTMARARSRARETGALDAPEAEPLFSPEEPEELAAEGYQPSLADFVLPIGVLLGVAILPFMLFDMDRINEAFLLCVMAAMFLAAARGMSLNVILDGFVTGCRNMTIGAIVLGLAVTLGTVSRDLGTATWVVQAIGETLPSVGLPAILMLLCMGIAFSTGTSWGTYAVVFPVALPLAYALDPDPLYVQLCFGAVLGGAVFGDQCSPISDTTILSSMFTGCALLDPVQSQIPLAPAAATLAGAVATALAAVG